MKNLYLIIGRSGSGKTTIVNELEKLYQYKPVESYTTRPPRYENEQGHTFISKEEFDKMDMLAYTLFNGYEYGVDAQLLSDCDLYVIDIAGVKIMNERYHDKRLVTINVRCNRDQLINRMLTRHDQGDAIKSRLKNDDKMFAEEATFPFDHIVQNNDLMETVYLIKHIIDSEEQQ